MRVRILAALLLVVTTVGGLGFATATTSSKSAAVSAKAPAGAPPAPAQETPDEPGTIDGAKNPEQVSDQVAYSLLFRFLSNRKTEEEKQRARAYLRMVFGCKDCGTARETPEQRAETEEQVNAFLALAAEFEKRVGVLDQQAKAAKEARKVNPTSAAAKTQLLGLQKKKEALVNELVGSMSDRLGGKAADKVRRFLGEEFKQKVKIRPARKADQPKSEGAAA